ncbi:hypothetical protein D3C72_684260 [compost metagenome]
MNFTALESRFKSTWRTLPSSPRTMGGASASQVITFRPLLSANGSMVMAAASSMARGEKSSSMTVILPASILDRSNTSLISSSRWRALRKTRSRPWRCLALTSPRLPFMTSSVKPRIEFMGVRSSWLMLARNSLFSRLAARACSYRLAFSMAIAAWAASMVAISSSSSLKESAVSFSVQ